LFLLFLPTTISFYNRSLTKNKFVFWRCGGRLICCCQPVVRPTKKTNKNPAFSSMLSSMTKFKICILFVLLFVGCPREPRTRFNQPDCLLSPLWKYMLRWPSFFVVFVEDGANGRGRGVSPGVRSINKFNNE